MSWAIDGLIEAILTWFAEVIVGALNLLWDLLVDGVFVSPDVTGLPQVRAFAGASLGIVNTAYVLAFLATFLLIMGRESIQSRYGPGELIPRLVIGLIAANFAVPLCSTLIQLANAITGALTSQDITAPASMQQMRTIVTGGLSDQSGASPAGFLMLLIGLIIAVMVAMLLMQWIVRLGVLIVAVGVAPIALALHGTPFTEGAAKLWWRTMLGTLGTVILQAVALHTTLQIFLDPNANLAALGLPGDPGSVFNLLVVLCLLWAVVKIPSVMRRYVTMSSPNQAATVLRVVLVQQLTRGLSRAAGRRALHGGVVRGSAGADRGTDAPWPTTTARGARSWPRSTPSTAARAASPTRVPSRPTTGA